jgi:hypothetical protein
LTLGYFEIAGRTDAAGSQKTGKARRARLSVAQAQHPWTEVAHFAIIFRPRVAMFSQPCFMFLDY